MMNSHFEEMAETAPVNWLDEEPPTKACCECQKPLEPAKHWKKPQWLPAPDICYDCERKDEGDRRDKERRESSFEAAMSEAGIPTRPMRAAKSLGLRKPVGPLDNFTRSDPEEGQSFYLHGPTGTGKTLQSCVALRIFLFRWIVQSNRRVTGRYAHLGDIIERTKRSFNGDEKVDWSALESCDLLVLDDLTTERGTPFASETIGNLIDYRYREMKSTLFVSNVAPGDLAGSTGAYDDRVTGRILEMCGGDSVSQMRLGKRYRMGQQQTIEGGVQ